MTTTPAPQGLPLNQYLAGQVAQPTLPEGATFTPQLLPTDNATLAATGQLFDPNTPNVMMNQSTPVAAPQVNPAAQINPVTGQAQTVDANPALAQINPAAGQYNATQVGANAPQAVAQQGTVSNEATVRGQLEQLYNEAQPGMVPTWAKGAVNQANDVMAARGLGASTIGTTALALAIQQSALPIAAQDASTYFQMDLTNLSNRQQTEFENIRIKQQAMLSDAAADNASKQFNAANASQTQQFMSTLVSNIMTQNADRLQSMSQFNAGVENQAAFTNIANQIQVETFNAQQQAAIDTFNEQQAFARESFNSQAAFAIEQSNVLWRRSINTENTAAINAANQVNVQNAYNLSATAQNQLWQQWRDEASWLFQASENQLDRDYNMAVAANNRAYYNKQNEFNWGKAAGSFVSGLFI
jgi:hypothetical protein